MLKLFHENNEELTETQDILEFQKRYQKILYKDQINASAAPIKAKIGENEKNMQRNKLSWKEKKYIKNYLQLLKIWKILKAQVVMDSRQNSLNYFGKIWTSLSLIL